MKANSEGQPAHRNIKGATADGANTLADAVAPHGGIIMEGVCHIIMSLMTGQNKLIMNLFRLTVSSERM